MALTRSTTIGLVAFALIVTVLGYLRDPPWLIDMTSGLSGWEVAEDGTRYRWTEGRASFFIHSDAEAIELRVRSIARTPGDWPINAIVSVDDTFYPRVTLPNDEWVSLRLPISGATSRRVRRVDIKLDRLRTEQRGIQLGEVTVRRRAR